MKIVKLESVIDNSFGGKAYGLSLLKRYGYLVPETFCIESMHSIDELDDSFKKELLSIIEERENYHFAVRSSSKVEDASTESKAGHYLTMIGNYDIDTLIDAIKQVVMSGEQMGVILQEAIDADYSGVFFSSNPTTFSKKTGILSYTHGSGDGLVSGICSGTDIEVCFENYSDPQFTNIVFKIKQLEGELGYPIDVEWCIKDNIIYYLQCRPITSITSVKPGLYKTDSNCILPNQITSHDKIQLRLEAEKANVFVADAYIHIDNQAFQDASKIKCSDSGGSVFSSSKYCKGYSIVVIYPQRISDKVVRSFVGSDSRLSQSVGKCYRYGVRSYPEYQDMQECIDTFHKKVADEYWVSAVIIQEIFDAAYTGIIQRLGNGFIIEITKGHFLTKGNVLTSQYYVENSCVTAIQEIHQQIWYRIVQGHVIECECYNENNNLVSLSNKQINDIVASFSDIIGSGNRIVEFGVIYKGLGLLPYLIDFVDSENETGLCGSDVADGIISRGKRCGVIRRIEDMYDSLDKHFHDDIETTEQISEEIIFLCQTPSISLLDLIGKYDSNKIAFVFAEGSVLCHLAVVLREKRIPAIKVGDIDGIAEGWYLLDAETQGLQGKERLKNE